MSLDWIDGDVHVHPCDSLDAVVTLPGSKSLTNRFLTCLALADGPSRLTNASLSDDAERMLDGLKQLGVRTEITSAGATIIIHGSNGRIPHDRSTIDVQHAGTAMRFLTSLASLGYGEYQIDGSQRMRERPIGALVDVLRQLGARIEYAENEGYPPLSVHAVGLRGGEARALAPESSQFISAVLMVSPYAAGDVFLEISGALPSRPYVDMTISLQRRMGVEVLQDDDDRFVVAASQRYQAGEYAIEPDASAATYFWAAAAVTGGRVRVTGLTRASIQGDVRFVDVLSRMGCTIHEGTDFIEVQGPPDRRLRPVNEDLNDMPDTVPTLAVLSLFANGRSEIRNVANLRLKETDRLAAISAELDRLGARIDVHRDGLTIFPPEEPQPAVIETYSDHRMAMSFSIAGLAAPGIVIRDARCVSKSFPEFFDTLSRILPA